MHRGVMPTTIVMRRGTTSTIVEVAEMTAVAGMIAEEAEIAEIAEIVEIATIIEKIAEIAEIEIKTKRLLPKEEDINGSIAHF